MKPHRFAPGRAKGAAICIIPGTHCRRTAPLRRTPARCTRAGGRARVSDQARIVAALAAATEVQGTRHRYIAELRPDDVRQFLASQLDAHRTPSNASRLASALRSYFRYRTTCGDQVGKLTAVILNPVHWKLASLPRALKPDEIERLLNSFTADLSLAEARLRHRSLRIGHGAAVVRDRQSDDRRHRLACRHGDAEGHEVAAAGHPALADGNRAGAGRLSADTSARAPPIQRSSFRRLGDSRSTDDCRCSPRRDPMGVSAHRPDAFPFACAAHTPWPAVWLRTAVRSRKSPTCCATVR